MYQRSSKRCAFRHGFIQASPAYAKFPQSSQYAGYSLLELILVIFVIAMIVLGGVQIVDIVRMNSSVDRTVRAIVTLQDAFYAWQQDHPFALVSLEPTTTPPYVDLAVFSSYIVDSDWSKLINGEGSQVRIRPAGSSVRMAVIETVVSSETHAFKVADRIPALVISPLDETETGASWTISVGLPVSGIVSALEETVMIDSRARSAMRRSLPFKPESAAVVSLGDPCEGYAIAMDESGRAATCQGIAGSSVWSLVDCNKDCPYGHTPTGDCSGCVCNLSCGEEFTEDLDACVCVCDLRCTGTSVPNSTCTRCGCDLACTDEGTVPNADCSECVCESGRFLNEDDECVVCTLTDTDCTSGDSYFDLDTCSCACDLECPIGERLNSSTCECELDCSALKDVVEQDGSCVCDEPGKIFVDQKGCYTSSELLVRGSCATLADDVAIEYLKFDEDDDIVYFYDEYVCDASIGCRCTNVVCLSKLIVEGFPHCFTSNVRHPDNICYDCLEDELGSSVPRVLRYYNNRPPSGITSACYDHNSSPPPSTDLYGAVGGACSSDSE